MHRPVVGFFLALVCALVCALAMPIAAQAQAPAQKSTEAEVTTCWCAAKETYDNCVWSCEAAAAGARSRKQSQSKIPDDMQIVVPAFVKARARLHQTGPEAPDFKQVYDDYRKARVRRDNALAEQYAAVGSKGLLAFLTGGAEFQKLDAMYEMRGPAQSAYHEYMMKMLGRLLDVGPAMAGQKPRESAMESAYGRGSPYWYAKVADEGELMVWAKANNGPIPKVQWDGKVEFMQRGSPKLYGDLTQEEQNKLKACLTDAQLTYPGNWNKYKDVAVRNEAEAYLKACKAKSCTTCVY